MGFDAKALLKEIEPAAVDAVVAVMVLAAAADEDFSDEERQELEKGVAALVVDTPLEGVLTDGLSERIAAAEAELERDRAALVAGAKQALAPAARKAALGLAVAVMAADGIIRTSEREVIMELAEALDVDRGEAADLVKQVTRPA